MPRPAVAGAAFAIGSAACFGTLAILVKLLYASGVTTFQLISTRFLVAALVLWVIVLATGRRPWAIGSRPLAILAVMGSTLYSLQAFGFVYAAAGLPASVVSLVLYTYPALVAIGARLFLGRPLPPRNLAALLASFVGVALLVGATPQLPLGPRLAAAVLAPLVYTVYILAGEVAMRKADPISAATVVMTAAAVTFTVVAGTAGELRIPGELRTAALLVAIGVVPTVAAITLFLAALPRIGGPAASLLSTFEPVVTVALAAVLLGESLTGLQGLGATVLLAAIVVLQWRLQPKTAGDAIAP